MSIVVHHLDCGRLNPIGGAWMREPGDPHLVCHCLLLELPDRLVLVDTGIGLADIADPRARLGQAFLRTWRPRLDPRATAVSRVEELGFALDDVRDVVVTHMDLDHVGGLSDFPHARVHVAAAELARALARDGVQDRLRYRPRQWSHGPDFHRYATHGEPWFGFDAVRGLDTLPPEILMIPLWGHSAGHTGVAIDTGDGWVLHCGDAYFHRGEVDRTQPRCPAGLRGFQRLAAADDPARVANQARLRALFETQPRDVTLLCAHDGEEFARCAGE